MAINSCKPVPCLIPIGVFLSLASLLFQNIKITFSCIMQNYKAFSFIMCILSMQFSNNIVKHYKNEKILCAELFRKKIIALVFYMHPSLIVIYKIIFRVFQ
jgi:hypothetical protein